MDGIIRDIGLAPGGEQKIEWAKRNAPLLRQIEDDFRVERPFADLTVALSIHLEAKTAYLCRVLAAGGARMIITGSNPLSTQDDVAAALAAGGLTVFAVHGCTAEEYDANIARVLSAKPNIIIDDGGDLVGLIHSKFSKLIPDIIGGCEETTTGIRRLHAMVKSGELRFPMFAVNDADCKRLFDNRYGTGQSVFAGIDRATNLIIAGKTVVVAGYGYCGKGVALRAKGLGANVIVTEIDSVRAIEAAMDGFRVMPMTEAAGVGDLFITVTGNRDVIGLRHFPLMKDGVILCNAGHFDVEVNVAALRAVAVSHRASRENVESYVMPDGKVLHLLGEGRLVNLACADGHPVEIMDMSFALQALCAAHLVRHRNQLAPTLHPVPREIDALVASRKLASIGISIDTLSAEQAEYLQSWRG